MKLTYENLHGAATSFGGFTKAQLAVFGVRWPPRHGWLRELIGREVTTEQYRAFCDARQIKSQSYLKHFRKQRRRARLNTPMLSPRTCTKCGQPVYWAAGRNNDWCEACMWAFIQPDQAVSERNPWDREFFKLTKTTKGEPHQ